MMTSESDCLLTTLPHQQEPSSGEGEASTQCDVAAAYGTFSTQPLIKVTNETRASSEDPRRLSRGDSGFYTDRSPETPRSKLQPSSVRQPSVFYAYMENRTSYVEHELRKVFTSHGDDEETLDVHSTVLSINNSEVEGYENITVSTEYVSETRRYRSAFGVLCQLKRIIVELKGQLEAYCESLDQLVGMGPEELAHEKAHHFKNFKNRVDACLVDVDAKMNVIRLSNNEIVLNGVRQSSKHSKMHTKGKFPVDCCSWCHGLLFLILLAMVTCMCLWSEKWTTYPEKWTVYLRLIRSPLIIILLFYLYGINMKVWASYKIDYITIFDHSRTDPPTPQYAFKVAGTLTFVFTVLVMGLILASPFSFKLPIKIIPLLMWSILLGFLVNPFDVFLRRARFNFILVVIHVIMSPFVFVYFSDFFLADQFNSTVGILLDLQYFVCYSITDLWSSRFNSTDCTSSGNGIRPILSFLPALWRMLQCLRCYYDTRKVKHLVNAVKYFTTFPVIMFASFFAAEAKGDIRGRITEFNWVIVCWAVSGFVHALYTFLWDVCCDWSLCDITKCTIFERRLIFKHKSLYWLAIILDLFLRFLWTLKLTLAIAWAMDSDLIYTGLVIAEILRRFIWNFIRVENAHVLSEKCVT